jgi:hypothetical protein
MSSELVRLRLIKAVPAQKADLLFGRRRPLRAKSERQFLSERFILNRREFGRAVSPRPTARPLNEVRRAVPARSARRFRVYGGSIAPWRDDARSDALQ